MKKKIKLIRGATLVVVIIGMVFIVLQINNWVAISDTFSLQAIEVNGNRLIKTEDILGQFNLENGVNVTNLNLAKIQQSIEKHPYVKAALVSRRLPSSLQIDIIERKPVAYISQSGKPLSATDREGTLLPLGTGILLGSLPVITGIEDLPNDVGELIKSDRVTKAIDLLMSNQKISTAYYQSFSEVHYDPKTGYVLYFNDGRFPVLFGRENFSKKAEKNFIFINKIKSENRYNKLSYVDLRFEDQVVANFN